MGKPELVKLLPGAGGAIARLNLAGWPVIVVTNQSGIARGYFTEADYARVRERLDELLAVHGAHIDASFMCPHHPDFTGPCDCRKPGTLLFRQAAERRRLDLAKSWYVGDKLRDVLPAGEFEGHGVLIPDAETPAEEIERARTEFSVASSLDEAAGRIIESAR